MWFNESRGKLAFRLTRGTTCARANARGPDGACTRRLTRSVIVMEIFHV